MDRQPKRMSRDFGFSQCVKKFHSIYGLSIIDPKKFRKTPSARRIFPKVFRRSRFWTSMMSIFQNFFDSCANSNRKITKLIYVIIGKKEEHNGHMFFMGAKSEFLAPKKCDM